MIDVNAYLEKLIPLLKTAFGGRLLYAGLQGSYMRGEPNENSDVDVMIVLDLLTVRDMDVYREILKTVGNFDMSCGFICGREELVRWTPLEICQLKHTTKDLFGKLSDYLPEAKREDEINYVKFSLGNVYHLLCHRYIHAEREKSVGKLRFAGKDFFYLIQNLYYLENGRFVITKKELKTLVRDDDREMLCLGELPDGYDFDRVYESVIRWCQNAFLRLDALKA
ncbi:MAG: nucleotidyltransferase domain-containing protein [Oscillospiraceae bacterium]|nr:nucleotidyltransferase domain-containing protein [Oscillospiraceae bacterium]